MQTWPFTSWILSISFSLDICGKFCYYKHMNSKVSLFLTICHQNLIESKNSFVSESKWKFVPQLKWSYQDVRLAANMKPLAAAAMCRGRTATSLWTCWCYQPLKTQMFLYWYVLYVQKRCFNCAFTHGNVNRSEFVFSFDFEYFSFIRQTVVSLLMPPTITNAGKKEKAWINLKTHEFSLIPAISWTPHPVGC